MKGDYSDCLKVISEHSELGACTRCPFTVKQVKIIFQWIKHLKSPVDEKSYGYTMKRLEMLGRQGSY